MLISFEGVTGAGKTTQARCLADRLSNEGRTVAYLPDLATLSIDRLGDTLFTLFASSGDPFHRHDSLLTDTLLAAAIRAQIVGAAITPALNKHDVVIEDRGVHTMYAYSLATALRGHCGLAPQQVQAWLSALGALAGIQADTAVWLHLPVTTAITRANRRNGVDYSGEQTSYLAYVDEAYQRLADDDPRLLRLNVGDLGADDVHELIYTEITRRLE